MSESENSLKECIQYAIKLLSRKDYSRFKLLSKLEDKNFSPTDINQTLDHLVEKNLFKEHFYTEARVKGLIRKKYSIKMIQNKLLQEEINLSTDEITRYLQEQDLSEELLIFNLIQKKLGDTHSIDFNKKAKLIRYLNSKGYQIYNIDKYLKNYQHESVDDY